MNIEFYGNMCVASGDNWSYEQIGKSKVFSQSGKVPSLRVVKTLIKLIASIELEPVKHTITHPYGGNGCFIAGGGGIGPAGGTLSLYGSGGGGGVGL